MQDNNDKAGTSLTEHMEPLQTVIFATTSLSEHLYVSLFMTIIIHFGVNLYWKCITLC